MFNHIVKWQREDAILQEHIIADIQDMEVPEARDLQSQAPTEAFWVFTNYVYEYKKGDLLINEANTTEVYRIFARVRTYSGHAEIPTELLSDDERQALFANKQRSGGEKTIELSPIQQLYIQIIFDYFHEQGVWPTYGHVERTLSQTHRDFHMREVTKDLPGGFANAFAFNIDRNQEAVLKVLAVSLCQNSEEELADFVRVLQFCVEKYFSFAENNLDITSEEIQERLEMPELAICKVGRLIEAEGTFWGTYGRRNVEGNKWTFKLTPGMDGIAFFDTVDSIELYLEKLDQRNKALTASLSRPLLYQDPSGMGDQYRMGDLQENTNTAAESKVKVLFLAANPKDSTRLRLDEEMRSIDLALRQAEFRDKFDIDQHWAVRVADIQGYLLRHQPDIVHFSGHGSASSDIILEDNNGNSQTVSPRALSRLFSVLKDNIRCVVLNACYSEQQAQAIAGTIDCVIGMSTAIGDPAAINFAAAFYQALGYGRNVKTAFDLGCLQIDLDDLDEQDTPQLLALNVNPETVTFI
jgi:hypothetical protein